MPAPHHPSPALDSVAVVGAGLAGLAAARQLADAGCSVTVFDKGRGPGGRTSTRRGDGVRFDHGAQYFTARDQRFQAVVAAWVDGEVAAPWRARVATLGDDGAAPKEGDTERFVGVPGMNAIAKHLAAELDVRCGVRVAPLGKRSDGRHRLTADDGRALGDFDAVLVTAPAPQAAELVAEYNELAARAADVEMTPCTAVMLHLEARWDLPFDGAFVGGDVLSWIARDSSKPGRGDAETWVLHSKPEWSRAHWDEGPAAVVAALRAEVERLSGVLAPTTVASDTHRWAFAQSTEPLDDGCLVDDASGLVLAGDWCAGNRVEGAWLSGLAAAEHLTHRRAAR